jgi:SAM-dependent methyltransferase
MTLTSTQDVIQFKEMISMSSCKIQYPLQPSWERFRKLFKGYSDLSVLRALEYEILEQLELTGRLLDFGGGANANYQTLMGKWMNGCIYETANIDPSIRPTYLISPGQSLPIAERAFDGVVTLNTLEHIYDVHGALRELYRVLKPGGGLIATVPFLFRIHGHPDDFLRGTPSWWGRTLTDLGYADVKITPLLWGPISTGLSVAGIPGPFKRLRMKLALILDIMYLRWVSRGNPEVRFSGATGESLCNSPLGFLVEAVKPNS